MNLQFFLKNPLIKIIGVVAIIYFGMFYDNDHPDSLGNRLSIDNVKKNINEVQQKVSDISQTIEIAKQNNQQISAERKFSELSFEKVFVGTGNNFIECGDEVNIIYKFYDDQNRILEMSENSQIIAFQSNEDLILTLIAQNISGIKNGAIIRAKFLGKYKEADQKLNKLLKIANYNLNLEVYVLSINPNKNNCLKND
jgi:hypothetical protein